MLSPSRTAGRLARRLTSSSRTGRGWFPAALLVASMTALAAGQDYTQQPYPEQNAQGLQAQDPPSRVARLSVAQGNVSVQPGSVQDFAPAEVNYPLTTGDRLWTDAGSQAELQLGQVAVRLGQQTDFTVTGLSDTLAQFGQAQGSVHLRTFALDEGTTTELDTPNASVTVLAPGDVRVDVYGSGAGQVTVITLLSGAAQVDAQGFSQALRPGESLQVNGTDPAYARDVRRPRGDGLDGFSAGQDSAYESALAAENSYVNEGTIGAADLQNYGDWSSDADYGPVWFPRNVGYGWQPYHYGHWAWVGPWGWTWVAAEPWGFAPFHYGRWGQFGGRWGWIPGPRIVRPVYSPALVAFVGRPGAGGPGGGGVTAWFPLGPREPFQPWYRTSDRYVTRVNVTNIYNRNTVEVRTVYAGRGPSPFRPDPNRQYVNRGVGTVAVPQGVFAGGRPVSGAALRMARGELDDAPVLARPPGAPTRNMPAQGPARALPPTIDRPALQGRSNNPPGPMRGPDQGFRNGERNGEQNGYRGGGQTTYTGTTPNGYQGATQSGTPGNGQPGYPNGGRGGYGSNGTYGASQNGAGTAGGTQPPRSAPVQPATGTQAPAQQPVPHAPVERPGNAGPVQVYPGPAYPGTRPQGTAPPAGNPQQPATSAPPVPRAPTERRPETMPPVNQAPTQFQQNPASRFGTGNGAREPAAQPVGNPMQGNAPAPLPRAPFQRAPGDQSVPSPAQGPPAPGNRNFGGSQPAGGAPQQTPFQRPNGNYPQQPQQIQQRPNFDAQRPTMQRNDAGRQPAAQPMNNPQPSRPAPPPPQAIPRPAPQAQPQPSRPAPANPNEHKPQ